MTTYNNLIAFKKEYLVEKINVATMDLAIALMKQVGYEYNPKLNVSTVILIHSTCMKSSRV